VFKKEDKQVSANYKGINLLDSALKLITKIINEKISEIIILADEQ